MPIKTGYKPREVKKGWYSIPGYSLYLASRDGMILNTVTNRISAGGNAGRYLKVSVVDDKTKQRQNIYLHYLICTAFQGPRPPNAVVLHLDNNRFNARASNLLWGTQSENMKQTYDDGIRKSTKGYKYARKSFESFTPSWLLLISES